MRNRHSNKRVTWQRTALAGAVAACFAGNTAMANPAGPAVAQDQDLTGGNSPMDATTDHVADARIEAPTLNPAALLPALLPMPLH